MHYKINIKSIANILGAIITISVVTIIVLVILEEKGYIIAKIIFDIFYHILSLSIGGLILIMITCIFLATQD